MTINAMSGLTPIDVTVFPQSNLDHLVDSWQRPASNCFSPSSDEAKSTLCEGNGLMIFYGVAKPVRAPQIGPARQP
jgi:hypothetical protein